MIKRWFLLGFLLFNPALALPLAVAAPQIPTAIAQQQVTPIDALLLQGNDQLTAGQFKAAVATYQQAVQQATEPARLAEAQS